MAKILILGAGSMGTAFSLPCVDNNHNVFVVGTHLENEFIDKINATKIHPILNCKISEKVKFLKFEKLGEIIKKEIDLIVIAVISKGIEWASIEINKLTKENIPILILTKGLAIHGDSYEVLAHKVERLLKKHGTQKTNITAAGGPCLAKGLVNKIHTSVVFANTNIKEAEKISKLVSTEYYHIFTSDDVIGVETCAAIKNIFSMIVGASKGLCYSSPSQTTNNNIYLNTAAALVQESIYEMIIFTEKLKGKKETVFGLAGIGDLYVSVDGGRNSKMGQYLGEGMTYSEAKKIKMPNETIEGADLALEIGQKTKNEFRNNELPLMISMIDTISNEVPLKIEWKHFK